MYSTIGSAYCAGLPCPAGKFGPLGSTNSLNATCFECSPGKFQPVTGMAQCADCPGGRFAANKGSTTTCKDHTCPPGYRVSSLPSEPQTCAVCSAGTAAASSIDKLQLEYGAGGVEDGDEAAIVAASAPYTHTDGKVYTLVWADPVYNEAASKASITSDEMTGLNKCSAEGTTGQDLLCRNERGNQFDAWAQKELTTPWSSVGTESQMTQVSQMTKYCQGWMYGPWGGGNGGLKNFRSVFDLKKAGLTGHTSLRLRMRAWFFGSWDKGEYFSIKLDSTGTTLGGGSKQMRCNGDENMRQITFSTQPLALAEKLDDPCYVDVDMTIPHVASTVTLNLLVSIGSSLLEEGWGFSELRLDAGNAQEQRIVNTPLGANKVMFSNCTACGEGKYQADSGKGACAVSTCKLGSRLSSGTAAAQQCAQCSAGMYGTAVLKEGKAYVPLTAAEMAPYWKDGTTWNSNRYAFFEKLKVSSWNPPTWFTKPTGMRGIWGKYVNVAYGNTPQNVVSNTFAGLKRHVGLRVTLKAWVAATWDKNERFIVKGDGKTLWSKTYANAGEFPHSTTSSRQFVRQTCGKYCSCRTSRDKYKCGSRTTNTVGHTVGHTVTMNCYEKCNSNCQDNDDCGGYEDCLAKGRCVLDTCVARGWKDTPFSLDRDKLVSLSEKTPTIKPAYLKWFSSASSATRGCYQDISVDIPGHTASTFRLEVSTSLSGDVNDEAWGFSDVVIAPLTSVFSHHSCTNCSVGKYSETRGATECIVDVCPLGTSMTQQSTSRAKKSTCKSCDAGTYGTQLNSCSACALGKYQPLKGQMRCAAAVGGEACPVGHFLNSTTKLSCEECSPGTKQGTAPLQATYATCADAVATMYQTILCREPDAGESAGYTATCENVNNPVSKSSQQGILTGSLRNSAEYMAKPAGYKECTTRQVCGTCDAGRFTPLSGQTACTNAACPRGQFQNSTIMRQCIDCPPGRKQQPTLPQVEVAHSGAGAVATQSSTAFEAAASRALDGSPSSHWSDKTVTSTAEQLNPWWRVKLGKAYAAVKKVTVLNRGDCCAEKLDGAVIIVGPNPNWESVQNKECGTIPSLAAGHSVYIACAGGGGLPGEYVFIVLKRTGALSLAEVYVWAEDDTSTPAESCAACPIGTFSSTVKATECSSCGAGKYGDETGQSGCKSCAPGQFQSSTGKATCQCCGRGTYSNDLTVGSYTACKPISISSLCPAGSGLRATCATSETDCALCAAGKTSAPTPKWKPLSGLEWTDAARKIEYVGTEHQTVTSSILGRTAKMSSVSACKGLCAATPGCAAIVWVRGSVRYGECWMSAGVADIGRASFCGRVGQMCESYALLTGGTPLSSSSSNVSATGVCTACPSTAFAHLYPMKELCKVCEQGKNEGTGVPFGYRLNAYSSASTLGKTCKAGAVGLPTASGITAWFSSEDLPDYSYSKFWEGFSDLPTLSQSNCLGAAIEEHGAKVTATRSTLQVGSWDADIPWGCSVQSGDLPQAQCALGYEMSESKTYCYMRVTQSKSWTAARAVCRGHDSSRVTDLAKIGSSTDNTWLMKKKWANFWIGVNDISTEGTWRNADGSAVTYTNWQPGEPNNSGNKEDCAMGGYGMRDTWNDANCVGSRNFVCGHPIASSTSEKGDWAAHWNNGGGGGPPRPLGTARTAAHSSQ